ncbi:hypothetical protein TNCV_3424201 [Trichonephila clavipes]|nr:hypothetical protein TNCV_3424201 [Trichonephila clavipes]
MSLFLIPPDLLCPQIEASEIHHCKGLDCTPIVTHSFEHHTGERTIWIGSTPYFGEEHVRGVHGLPPLFHFHHPHERTCDLTAIWNIPIPRRHYMLTKAFLPSPGFEGCGEITE